MLDATPLPRTLGDHDVVRRIGRGGMGIVVEVRSRATGVSYAAKLILRAHDPAARARFRREAELLARCDRHPGVVKVHSFGELEDGTLYMIMDLVRGEGLDQLLEREGRLQPERAARLVRDVAAALGHAHALGIVHRDVKPSNVLLGEKGDVKLTDFGLATACDLDGLTRSGVFVGTIRYCSPEQSLLQASVGPPADVFAAGCLLYFALTERTPLEDLQTPIQVVRELNQPTPLPDIRLFEPRVPEPLAAVVRRALEKAPAKRYANGAELALDLTRFLGGDLPSAAPPERVAPRRPGLLLALVVGPLFVLLTVVLGFVVASLVATQEVIPPPTSLTPFTVALDEPSDGVALVATRVAVRGHVEPKTAVSEVTINSVRVPVEGGRFESWLPLDGRSADVLVEAGSAQRRKTVKAHVVVKPPQWYERLDRDARPRWPLPPGVTFGGPREYVNRLDGSVLVYVPEGDFVLGSEIAQRKLNDVISSLNGSTPSHPVTLSAYFVGKYEVSVAQFRAFVRAKHYTTTAQELHSGDVIELEGAGTSRRGVSFEQPDRQGLDVPADEPVTQVSWLDAKAYVAWAGLALPSEAQWEKAALWDPVAQRARLYSWGDAAPSEETGLVVNGRDESTVRDAEPRFRESRFLQGYDDGFKRRAPVGSFPAGASVYGALDMIGNVGEWCEDAYDDHFYERTSGALDPVNERGELRVHRGGAWNSHPWMLIGASRPRAPEDYRSNSLGFRVARPESSR